MFDIFVFSLIFSVLMLIELAALRLGIRKKASSLTATR